MDNMKMVTETDMVYGHNKMGLSMMESGKMAVKMDLEYLQNLMEQDM